MIATAICSTLFLWLVLFGPAVFFGPEDEEPVDERWLELMDEVDRDHEAEWGRYERP